MAERRPLRDVGTSIRARLLAIAHKSGQQFDLLLTRYAIERLLYRLSVSAYRERFVLKGAMLVTTWFDNPHRPTRDVDLLGYGDPEVQQMLATFGEICAIDAQDGLVFDVAGLRAEPIREETDYGGLRLRTSAQLAGAKIPIVIDIGFGDATEPGTEEAQLPVLLDLPKPTLRVYARETVIAEKFQAIVMLGMANTRLKDYYDIWFLAQDAEFDGQRMTAAIAGTFGRRKTPIPTEIPDGLSEAFAANDAKQKQWQAFVRDLAPVPALEVVVSHVAGFLMPFAAGAVALSAPEAG